MEDTQLCLYIACSFCPGKSFIQHCCSTLLISSNSIYQYLIECLIIAFAERDLPASNGWMTSNWDPRGALTAPETFIYSFIFTFVTQLRTPQLNCLYSIQTIFIVASIVRTSSDHQIKMSATILRSSNIIRSRLRTSNTLFNIARPATIPSFARGKATLPDLPCKSFPFSSFEFLSV